MREISAGGVVFWRIGKMADEEVRVQMIHDRFGKVTLAKGKIEIGEQIEETALREIWEETGIHGKIVRPIQTVKYSYKHPERGPVDKEVHYFLVEAIGGDTLSAQVEEIDGVDWYSPQEALTLQHEQGYRNNDEVVEAGLQMLREMVVDG
jgi:diadenosine hexaphosphate hydrolase (ATP-forming)